MKSHELPLNNTKNHMKQRVSFFLGKKMMNQSLPWLKLSAAPSSWRCASWRGWKWFPQEMPKTPPGKLEKMWKRCGKHQRSTILESLFTLFPFFDIFWELPERGNSSMKERNVHIIHGICGADKNTQL